MSDRTLAKKDEVNLATDMYKESVNVGTEDMSQDDLNTPVLKILQNNTQNVLGKTDGWYFRSDTQQQMDEVDVNLVYVTTQEVDNYNKNGKEIVKVYYGFYDKTNEPFKMFVRGWGLGGHRKFQTQVANIKSKFGLPMLSLKVRLTTEEQKGVLPDSGKPYLVYKPVFTILRNEEGNAPLVETDIERGQFLIEAARRFKGMSSMESVNDAIQNDIPDESENANAKTDEDMDPDGDVSPDDIPF